MSFESLDLVFKVVEQQPSWEQVREYKKLLAIWLNIVGEKIAHHSRPTAIDRQVLYVATSSAAWAQNLSLQRHQMLKKLNEFFTEPIVDIRFSSARWYTNSQGAIADLPAETMANHPSIVPLKAIESEVPISDNLQEVFAHWLRHLQKRTEELPSCPRCHCPTPPGELQRYSMCVYCATSSNLY